VVVRRCEEGKMGAVALEVFRCYPGSMVRIIVETRETTTLSFPAVANGLCFQDLHDVDLTGGAVGRRYR